MYVCVEWSPLTILHKHKKVTKTTDNKAEIYECLQMPKMI